MNGKNFLITFLAAILVGALFPLRASQADNLSQNYHETPPFITTAVSPKVMLVMGRNHKLFYQAYNDASDLNGDGEIDITYKPDEIDYYGYFDSYKCYRYVNGRFEPSCDSDPDTKTCSDLSLYEWSGDFLNYLTMSRMDALRKVLYGGKRSTDEDDETVLQRAYIPQDAHSWGKSYNSTETDGYDISNYTPFSEPDDDERHLFASTTLSAPDSDGDYNPLLRVVKDTEHRIWEWTAKERPVCDDPPDNMMNPDGSEENVAIDKDYTVRVEVGKCSESDNSGVYSGSKSYNSTLPPKPVGLLQRYGKDGDMHFGLLTGSYTNNISGGVLRKNISSFEDEIDPNTGVFTDEKGIVHTIDHLRIKNFEYSNHDYPGGWYTDGPMSDSDAPDFPDWGNPLAEMLYESLKYYSGGSETPDFASDVYEGNDEGLDLPNPDWEDPYNSTDYCADAHILTISDIYPTFDSDEVPGARWGPGPETIGNAGEQLDAQAIGDEIYNEEIGSPGSRFIGCSGSNEGDFSCSAKNVNSFGNIRGLCPEEPTKEGSYYSASVAHYARTNDLSSVQGNQTIANYMVGLSSPRPRIEIPVMDGKVTVVPFGKSVGGDYGISPDEEDDYQPTNTIVDYFVEDISPTRGSFRINFEDVEQGADHDMDAIVRYTYQLVDDDGDPVVNATAGSKVKITVESEYSAGSIIQHLGYIISGTQSDGTYLVVRDTDLDGGGTKVPEYSTEANNTDVAYFLDNPETEDDLGLSNSTTFIPSSSTEAATTLKNPLWYAAKWGGFDDLDGDGTPNQQNEWDEDNDGDPDSYFYVQNPLKLEEKLNKVFADILQRTSGGTSIASLTERTTSGALISQAVFYPQKRMGGHEVNWLGYLYSYWFLNELNVQNLREDTPPSINSGNANKALDIVGDRILEFNSTATSLDINVYSSHANGTKDQLEDTYHSLDKVNPVWEAGEKLRDRNATEREIYGVTQNDQMTEFVAANATHFEQNFGDNQDQFPTCLLNGTTPEYGKLIRFLRGEDIPGCRTRETGEGVWKLGDIVHSTPETVTYEDEGYSLVFTGANDGMLHAFRMGKLVRQSDDLQPTKLCNSDSGSCETDLLGKEEWAFVPKNAMPYLRYTAFPSYSHINTIDLKPYVIQQEKGGSKKILIGGMRFGGACGADVHKFDAVHPPPDTCADRDGSDCTGRSAYFALDVTDPQNPEYLWSFSPPDLGYSYSGPAYIKRKDPMASDNKWKHYVMFASGPTSYDGYSAQPLKFFVLDLESGSKVDEVETSKKNAFGGRLFTDGLDLDGDYQTDYVFMGYTEKSSESTTAGGGVMKIWTGATDVHDSPVLSDWSYDNYFNLADTSVVSRIIPMQCFGNQWYLYFGTGRYFYATDDDMDVNYLYGLPLTCNPKTNSCDTGTINSAHNTETMDCGDVYMEGTNPNQAGWKRKLKEESEISGDYMIERNYADPSPTPFNVVFFNPAMPTADPCGFGGKSRSFALNCATGSGLMDDECDNYTVDVKTFKYLVQLSGGDIKQYSPGDFSGGGGTAPTPGVPSEEGGIPMTGASTTGEILLWLEK